MLACFFMGMRKKSGQPMLSAPKRGNTRKPYNQRFASFPFFYTKENKKFSVRLKNEQRLTVM
jgi:hypothetical protein